MLSILRYGNPRLVYVVTHRLADVDAYCAAVAVAGLLRKIANASNVRVVIPEGLNAVAKRVYEQFPIKLEDEPEYSDADVIAIVDTNNPLLLADSEEGVVNSRAKKILIDHHPLAKGLKKIADFVFVDTKASSACEVVYDLFKSSKMPISKRVAQILLLGVMADSQHLFLASDKTIGAAADLIERGASLRKAKRVLTREREGPEKMARLKGARRSTLYTVGGFVLAVTKVGSYHASAAKGLVDLGADLAVAIGGNGKEARASLRSTQRFFEKTGIHLGTDVAASLTDFGGGHPTAASVSKIPYGEKELLDLLLEKIAAKLGKFKPMA